VCAGEGIPPIQTDRPDQTETPFAVPAGHLQIESGFAREWTDESTRSLSSPSVLVRLALGDRFEARFAGEYASISGAGTQPSGFLPASAGVKIEMADEDGAIPATALIGHLTLPRLSSEAFRAAFLAPSFRFSMQHTASERLSVGYNLGAEWDGETPEPVYLYTLTAGLALFESAGCYIEIYGFARDAGPTDHLLNGGCAWLIGKNVQIDCSGGIGLTPSAPDGFVAAGISFRIPD
jgi:hypothetical protein